MLQCLALDLGRRAGWAAGPLSCSPSFGSFVVGGGTWGEIAVDLEGHVLGLLRRHRPAVVAYEAPIVLHPHAGQVLAGMAFMVEYLAASHGGLLCLPIPNSEAKHAFAGRTYSKKEDPYPGCVEARRRGFDVRTTDEADALSVWYAVRAKLDAGLLEVGAHEGHAH